MAKVVAVDAGTTGVRALVVDEHARVADVAYRELTQYFPRPGWVEHDPAEIWDSVRATLAEVGGRLAEAGETVAAIGITNQRETLVAFDRSTGRPLHRAIVWQDRRHRALCAELTEAGHLPFVRATTGLVLDPYFSATKAAWLLRQGDLPLAAVRPGPLLLHGRHLGAVEPDRGARRRRLRHRPLQRQPHPPARYGHARLVPRALRPLRRARAHAARGAPVGRPLRHRRAGRPRPRVRRPRRCPGLGRARRPAGRALRAGLLRAGHGQGHLRHRQLRSGQRRAPDARPRPTASRSAAPGISATHAPAAHGRVAYALEGSAFVSGAAIQWLRDGLGIIASAAEVGPLAASVPDSGGVTFVPALTGLGSPWWDPAGARHRHRPHPRRRPGPDRPGLCRGDGIPGARHDRCHGRRLFPPAVRAAGGRGRRRHGPPPRAAGRAEPHAGGAPAPRSSRPRSAPPPSPAWPRVCGPRWTSWPALGRPRRSSNRSCRPS